MKPEISNWGRWGEDDQLGQLNLMTQLSILDAFKLVKRGKIYNLAVPVDTNGIQAPMLHKTMQVTSFTTDKRPGASNVADDVVIMETHSGTHIDSIAHFSKDGLLWNGRSADNVSSRGLEWAGMEKVPGIVARGVLLDLPAYKNVPSLGVGELVTTQDMDGCAAAQGVEIRAGDILLLRTGWLNVFHQQRALYDQGEPGPDATCTAWLKEKDVIAVGADNFGVERMLMAKRNRLDPRLHVTALRDLGVYLIENLDLEELARDKTYEFLFMAAPVRLAKASGAPLSPLAIV